MFSIGDTIIYSVHGLCEIDDICEKTFAGVTKKYYELHPIKDSKLKISIPIDSDKVTMLEIMDKDEAEKMLKSFTEPGVEWIESSSERTKVYSEIIKSGNRREVSKVLNTLLKRKNKVEVLGKRFHSQDKKLLTFIENILFTELSFALDTTFEQVEEKINKLIK